MKKRVEIKLDDGATVQGILLAVEKSGNLIVRNKGDLTIVRKNAVNSISMNIEKVRFGPYVEIVFA